MLRKDRGWTQLQLADMLEMTAHHLSRWENDRIRPRDKTLEKLAQVFEVPLNELVATKIEGIGLSPDDSELASLLAEVPNLDDEQRKVLKHVLRSMVTCNQMERLLTQGRFRHAS